MFLDVYEKVFPEAGSCRRTAYVSSVLPSASDLYDSMLEGGNPWIDPLYVGTLNMDQWGILLTGARVPGRPARDVKFFDMGFMDSRPTRSPRSASSTDGSATSDLRHGRAHARVRADNPKDKYGKHEYEARTLDDRGCVALALLPYRTGRVILG